METLVKLPPKLAERWELEEEIRYPATYQEFWETMVECDYKVEYHDGQIVSFMSYATDPHELLVSTIVYLLGRQFFDRDGYFIYPSNRPVITPGHNVYNPDASLTIGKTDLFQYAKGKNAMTNPALIVEVLSKSTKNYDLNEKLPEYQRMDSLQQILYIDSQRMHVTTWLRTEAQNQWRKHEFSETEAVFPVLDEQLPLQDLYRKIDFSASA